MKSLILFASTDCFSGQTDKVLPRSHTFLSKQFEGNMVGQSRISAFHWWVEL